MFENTVFLRLRLAYFGGGVGDDENRWCQSGGLGRRGGGPSQHTKTKISFSHLNHINGLYLLNKLIRLWLKDFYRLILLVFYEIDNQIYF